MLNLLLFALAVTGMTHIFVDSDLFKSVREWVKDKSDFWYNVLDCHQCCGFWCGAVMGLILMSWNPILWVVYGCAGSILSVFTSLTIGLVNAIENLILTKTEYSLEVIDKDVTNEVRDTL